VQRLIEDPLSEEVLLGRFGEGDTIVAELDDDNHVHFARGGEEPKEPVAAAPKRSKKETAPDLPAEDEETAETA
jgi:ATP-dependent Clp protease ATP-binding subunit ClpC